MPSETLKVVDLFCGAGGIACGFELHAGALRYETVLAVDNAKAALRIFNENFPASPDATLQRGRLTDVTWFTHPAEIRLFYLVHLAHSGRDVQLRKNLDTMGLSKFLAELREIDAHFAQLAEQLAADSAYREAASQIPAGAFNLALPQAILDAFALTSFTKPGPSLGKLPWSEEYTHLPAVADEGKAACDRPIDRELAADARAVWSLRTGQLREAASKTGHGQNRNNAARLRGLTAFLDSAAASTLRKAWCQWRAARDTVRASFCLDSEGQIDQLYSEDRRVHAVLGGPPCKGFSRIGRPVIDSLRDQGVHAWSHKDYGDERNSLMCQYVLFLEALRPDIFLFENVSNFQSALKTPAGVLDAPALLEELIDDLSSGHLHYHVQSRLVNARSFAVPQDRRRFIMFGVNAERATEAACRQFFSFESEFEDVPLSYALLGLGEPAAFRPEDGVRSNYQSPVLHFFDEALPSGARTYLAWVRQPDPVSGAVPSTTTAHVYREGRDDDRAFIEFVAPGIRWMDLKTLRSRTLAELRETLQTALQEVSGETKQRIRALLPKIDESLMLRLLLEHTQERNDLPEQHLLLDGYLKNGGSTHGDWLERLSPNKPCKTIVAHIGKDTYGYWHPTAARALSIREAARVQSFPDFFRLNVSGIVDTYAALGNAVPPLMSARFARRIEQLHTRCNLFGGRVEPSVKTRTLPRKQLDLAI